MSDPVRPPLAMSSASADGPGAVTGRRRRRDLRPAPIWVPLVVGLMGLPLFALGLNAVRSEQRFGDEGVAATGHVLQLRQERSTDEDDTDGYDHFLDYEFADAAGAVHRGSAKVSASTYAERSVGSTVTVTYLPDAPTEFRLGRPTPDLGMPLGITGLGGLLGAVGFGAFAITFVRRRRAPQPAVRGPDFAIEVTPATQGPMNRSFKRHAASILDGTSVDGGGLAGGIVNMAIEGVADATRDRDHAPDVLAVGASGLTIPGLGLLEWEAVDEVRASEALLSVVPRDSSRLGAFAAPEGSAWRVGPLGGTYRSDGSFVPALNIRLGEVEEWEEMIETIARHRIVDIDR